MSYQVTTISQSNTVFRCATVLPVFHSIQLTIETAEQLQVKHFAQRLTFLVVLGFETPSNQ